MLDLLPFGEWRPDVSDLNQSHTQNVLNVLPQADGYGPFKSLSEVSEALGSPCRGAFVARNADLTVSIFAATADRLYLLDNTTFAWVDVSQGGAAYTEVGTKNSWWFLQFRGFVIAGHVGTDPQVFTLATDTEFSDLGGSPPRASFGVVISSFVVLGGLSGEPRKIQWSGLNAPSTWDGSNSSGEQEFADGGEVLGATRGEFGLIIQEQAVRRMVFSPGSEAIFEIDRLASDIGAVSQGSIVDADGVAYFLSPQGFVRFAPDGSRAYIGRERVDRFFLGAYDDEAPQYVIGSIDPAANAIIWTFRTDGATGLHADAALIFDTALQRWSRISADIQFAAAIAQPGTTLEGLDAEGEVAVTGAADNGSGLIRLTVADTSGMATGHYRAISGVTGTTEANGSWYITVIDGTTIDLQGSAFSNAYVSGGAVGGSLDALTTPFDSIAQASLPMVAFFTSDGKLAFATGSNLEATLDTAEQTASPRRILLRGFYPETDAAAVYGRTAYRATPQASPSLTSEAAANSNGLVPQRRDTRLARARLRIPAGTAWSYATGVRPDFTFTGVR